MVGTWSRKDGVLKCGSEVVAYFYDTKENKRLFDWVCKTLNEQEGLAKELLEKQLKDLKPIVNETNETHEKKPFVGHDGLTWPNTFDHDVWATEFCSRNTASNKSTMIGWFGNAIMRGYHTANREKGKQDIVNSLDDSKTAMLHLKKVVVNGKKTFKLVGFENILRNDQLPKEYIDSAPNFYLDTASGQIVMNLIPMFKHINNNSFTLRFTIGDEIDTEYIKDFKDCGERLASINKKLKEVKPERFTVSI